MTYEEAAKLVDEEIALEKEIFELSQKIVELRERKPLGYRRALIKAYMHSGDEQVMKARAEVIDVMNAAIRTRREALAKEEYLLHLP